MVADRWLALTALSGGGVEVRSAGSEPADQINAVAVEAMAEVGIDIAGESPKLLMSESVRDSDVVITMGCGDTCPIFPGQRTRRQARLGLDEGIRLSAALEFRWHDESVTNRGASMLLVLAAASVVVPVTLILPAQAADSTVQGYIYRDLNNDGVRDVSEPAVPGVVLRSGNRATITDADGHYEFTNVASAIKIRADAGWFRSQCTASYSGPSHGSAYTVLCPDPGSGAGIDQDFSVDNQLLTSMAAPGETSSLGLTPDWVGVGYTGFSTDPVAATTLDPALRLSPGYRMPGAATDCVNYVCRPGETQWVLAQWLNQGTSALSKVRGIISAPVGSLVTQITPYLGHQKSSGQSVTGLSAFDITNSTALGIGSQGWLSQPSARVRVSLRGKLLPGSAYLMAVGYRMNVDAPFSDGNNDGVPDCSADTGQANPGQTCTLATDFSPGSYVAWGAVTHIAHGSDEDAILCPHVPKRCLALGVHDKTKPGDSNDAGAWKVDSVFPPGA